MSVSDGWWQAMQSRWKVVTKTSSTSRKETQLDESMTAWGRAQAKSFGLMSLADCLIVVWNPRMRSAAGRAFCHQDRIELNPLLLQISKEEVERTLRHELAHLIAQARSGKRRIAAHGSEWRRACADLGIAGEKACHRLPLPKRTQMRRHHYQCPHCLVQIHRVQIIRRKVACAACCRSFSSGRFDEKFLLQKIS